MTYKYLYQQSSTAFVCVGKFFSVCRANIHLCVDVCCKTIDKLVNKFIRQKRDRRVNSVLLHKSIRLNTIIRKTRTHQEMR